MAYKHGVYIYEQPTSLTPPSEASAGLPVVFGTAPVNLVKEGKVNEPVLLYSYKEAVETFGYSKDWKKYTLCEFMKSHFALFNVTPVVFINVLNPEVHKTEVASKEITITKKIGIIKDEGILLDSIVIKSGVDTCLVGTDYTAAFDSNGNTVITIKDGGKLISSPTVTLTYNKLDPSKITNDDIIGGIDIVTGKSEGLELVNQVFPRFRLIPGQIIAPGFSKYPNVAAVMDAKSENINGHFKCISLADIDTTKAKKYSDVAAWKENNNYVSSQQVVCWPLVKLEDEVFHLSTQLAGDICKTDGLNEDIPYVSPSNNKLNINGLVIEGGEEVILAPDTAAYLNGQGIVTALNFIEGWKAWGNRTGAYPGNSDPKDTFIPVRRMLNWIANTLVLTFWQKVDNPMNKRLVESVIDSANMWLNGLRARGFILGGRVEMLLSENPLTDLMDGTVKFHLYVTPPSPAREIDFILEYDPQYLKTLFG